jgi:hypothetical protein
MLQKFGARNWDGTFSLDEQQNAICGLERGEILLFPNLSFAIDAHEKHLIKPEVVNKSKNVSYNPAKKTIGGTNCAPADAGVLAAMMARFSDNAHTLVRSVLPSYQKAVARGRTSFRPVQVEGRVTSWRKDDTRLHVDAFPSSPTQGKRILRVFSNVNPEGRPRTWKAGEPFETVAQRFLPQLKRPVLGASRMQHLLRITKSYRTDYDAFMLQLHDRMKEDNDYQTEAKHQIIDFPAGSTWMVYTDQVSHAALSGQFQFEQTFYLPVSAMQQASTSPLKVLERLSNRALV